MDGKCWIGHRRVSGRKVCSKQVSSTLSRFKDFFQVPVAAELQEKRYACFLVRLNTVFRTTMEVLVCSQNCILHPNIDLIAWEMERKMFLRIFFFFTNDSKNDQILIFFGKVSQILNLVSTKSIFRTSSYNIKWCITWVRFMSPFRLKYWHALHPKIVLRLKQICCSCHWSVLGTHQSYAQNIFMPL